MPKSKQGLIVKCDECLNEVYIVGKRRISRIKKYCSKECRVKNLRVVIQNYWNSVDPIKRFWEFVNKDIGQGPNGDCWEWQGSINKAHKYGVIRMRRKNGISQFRAHRFSYMQANNLEDLPKGLVVMHSCDNKICVNPSHLSLGTVAQNSKDASDRGLYERGEDRSKLKTYEVIEIREKFSNGASKHMLAKNYKVSWKNIDCIIKRKTWKHV